MPVNTELYDLVKEAKKTLREENKPVNAKAVIKHVQRRAENVLFVYNELEEQEQAKRDAEKERLLSESLRNELSKYGEDCANEKTLTLKKALERHKSTEELLVEEITIIRDELASVHDQSRMEQATLTKTINGLKQVKSELKGTISSQLGEIKVLTEDRKTAREERYKSEVKLSGLKQTLAIKSADERRERSQAKSLQKQLDEAKTSIGSLKEEIKKLKKRKSPSRASQTPQTDND
jgi:chromosome segregation ATPase